MLKRNKMERLVSRTFTSLRNAWTFARVRIVLISGLIVGTVTLLGAIMNGREYLATLGLIDNKPLRIVSSRLSNNIEGAKVLELMLRNIGKEPIIITDLALKPKRIVDLLPCGGFLTSALQISNKYNVDISAAQAGVGISTDLNQQLKGGASDRFQIILESNRLHRVYDFEAYVIYNENRSILPVGRMAISYTDVAADYLPDESQLPKLTGQSPELSCYYYNSEQLIVQHELLQDAATNALTVRAGTFQSWLINTVAPGERQQLKVASDRFSEEQKSVENIKVKIDCRALYQDLQSPGAGAVVRIVLRGVGPVSQRHVCSGFLVRTHKIVIMTAAHCFFNRRTGARIDPQEFAVVLIDVSEFPIKDVDIKDYDLTTGGSDSATVELFEEVSLKNYNDQCVKKD